MINNNKNEIKEIKEGILKINIKLDHNEKVLFYQKALTNVRFALFYGCICVLISGYFFFIGYLGILHSSILLIVLGILIGILMIIYGIYFTHYLLRELRSTYYITTNRLIKIYGKGLFHTRPKYEKLNFKDIAFFSIEEPFNISLYKKKLKDKPPNRSFEYDYQHLIRRRNPFIKIQLEQDGAEIVSRNIINLLVKLLHAKKHENLEEVYIPYEMI
ncbi:MAG: hypothetical protein ACFFHD_12665 [Promethearchaeota archaeon]